MPRKRKANPQPIPQPSKAEPASPQTAGDFSTRLSPVMGCPATAKDKSKAISISVFIGGVLLAVIPMSGLTRSLFLLLILGPLLYLLWSSPWTHLWKTTPKIAVSSLLCVAYLVIATALVANDYPSVLTTLNAISHSENFLRAILFVAGLISYSLLLKCFLLIKGYVKSRKAARQAALAKFREPQKEWLDYRADSEESSSRLHVLIGRQGREMGRLAYSMVVARRALGRKPSALRAHSAAYLFATFLTKYGDRVEPKLEEFRSTVDVFVESTEGHLKTCRQDYGKLEFAYQYFKKQHKDLAEYRSMTSELAGTLGQLRGVSQDLTASCNRLIAFWQAHLQLIRRLEGHCARMIKLAEARRDRSIERAVIKPLKQLASTLIKTVETMAEQDKDEELREKANELRDLAGPLNH